MGRKSEREKGELVMKVLLLNGSSREKGCTAVALNEVARTLNLEGIETEFVFIGNDPVRDCTACGVCRKTGNGICVFDDDMINPLIRKAGECHGFVFGSPVYYSHPSGRILSVLDRLFFAGSWAFRRKPGAAVVSARRGGTTASIDVLNKYFTICEMPVVSSSYWNMVHGADPEDVLQDEEGMLVMRNLGRNMAWLLRSIEEGKRAGVRQPENEYGVWTNFIR